MRERTPASRTAGAISPTTGSRRTTRIPGPRRRPTARCSAIPTWPRRSPSIGKVLCWHEWDFAGAERQLRRAVTLNDNYAEAHWAFGSVLPTVGRLAEAIEELRKALVLDPLYAAYSRWLGRFLLFSGDYSGAIAQARKTIDLDADYAYSYLDIGSRVPGARRCREGPAVVSAGPGARHERPILRRADRAGPGAPGTARGSRRDPRPAGGGVPAALRAIRDHGDGPCRGGQFRPAPSQSLERAFQARSAGLIYLHVDPGYTSLRADPRFRQLVERIGLR